MVLGNDIANSCRIQNYNFPLGHAYEGWLPRGHSRSAPRCEHVLEEWQPKRMQKGKQRPLV